MGNEYFNINDYADCEIWITQQLNNNKSWDEIDNLCVIESEFDAKLDSMIEDEMWPNDLNRKRWLEYVKYFRKIHPKLVETEGKTVIGIDEQGFNNTFLVPSGAASTWEQYKKALRDSLGPQSIVDIEKSCHWVMNHLKEETDYRDPVKGLVTGSVQSGKTANMCGLISMAADCNWNFFIVLSGTIDNLRKQTRDRFRRDLKTSEGVLWKILDFSGEDKNFSAQHLTLNPLGKKAFAYRYATVCLKNKRRLESLIDWLYSEENRTQKLRIVVIDDEADQASINTAEITEDEEQDRVAINRLIVNLVNGRKADGTLPKVHFQSMNYISYTATPYANVLNEAPGESLYPKDFICTLPESSEYFGPKVIFGNDEKDIPDFGIIRNISTSDDKELKKLHKGHQTSLPSSMKSSIAWFLCASGIIRFRNRKKKKSISMLIHTTAIQNQHFNVYDAIGLWLQNKNNVLETCETVYKDEIGKVTVNDLKASNPEYGFLDEVDDKYPEFSEIKEFVIEMLTEIQSIKLEDDNSLSYGKGIHLCVDNCKANREAEEGTVLRIVYPNDSQLAEMDTDPVFIVIGGNTLSRGLTIDGLVCSYFSRNSNQADTLMQMARWFGYRKGYELLQRIWMTTAVQEKFEALAKIDSDMKEEIQRFMERGISPSQFGPRIRNIPEIKSFRITSKKKSQMAEFDDFDFRGDSYETTDFVNDAFLKSNLLKTRQFLNRLSSLTIPFVSSTGKGFVWDKIPAVEIKKFLFNDYHIYDKSSLYNNLPVFFEWLEKEQEDGHYIFWNVAVIDGDNKVELWDISESISVGKIERTKKDNKDHIDIGSLRSGIDALIDVKESELNSEEAMKLKTVLKKKQNIIASRSDLRLNDVPLLLIYCIKQDGGVTKGRRIQMDADEDIIGISIIVSGDGIGGNHAKSLRIKIKES